MITFVTIAASIEAPRSFMFDVLGTASEPEAVQSFFDGPPEHASGALLAVVYAQSEEHDTWAECIDAHTSRAVKRVASPVSLTSGHVYVVPPGVVLRLDDGGLMLEQSSATAAEIPLEPLLQALIDDDVTPVRLVLSQNGRGERNGRPSMPPSGEMRLSSLRPLSPSSGSGWTAGSAAQEEEGEQDAADDVEQRLRDTKTDLRKRTQQVRRLSQALIRAKEDERKRIREILHDDLQQLLFAARMNVQNLQERAPLRAAHDALASRVEELLTDGLRVTRGLSAHLTVPDEERSLVAQFEWLAVRMQETYGLQVTVVSRGQPEVVVDDDHRILLYRLVQELLFNVVKHAGVEEATLRVLDEEEALRIEVEDEGDGFDLDDATSRSSIGLDSVFERIEMIGGTASLDSAPGEGTRVRIVIPYAVGGTGRSDSNG
jgi:signal transduction histidine kinase